MSVSKASSSAASSVSGRKGRPAREEQTRRRDLLLDAALDEFIVNGFSGANIETIAGKAGVGKSTIYRNYQTKEGLLLAVVSRRMQELGTRWSELNLEIDDPEGSLYRIALMSYNEWSGKSLPIYRIIYTEAARLPELARAVHNLTLTEAIKPVSAYFQQLQDRGWISVKNVTDTASMFLVTAVGGVRLLMVPNLLNDEAREQLAVDAVQLFLYGCATAHLPKKSI